MLRSALCRPSWDRPPPYRRCSSPQWQQQQQRVWRHLARLPVEGVAVVVVCCHFMCNCNNLQRPIRAICTRTTLITILLRAPGIDAAGRGRGRGGDQAGTNPAYRPASAAGAGNPLLPPTAFMSPPAGGPVPIAAPRVQYPPMPAGLQMPYQAAQPQYQPYPAQAQPQGVRDNQ